jgi:hypothetical protein
MNQPLKVGVEFSQRGAEQIGSAYEAAIKRVTAATAKADAELANLMGQGREDSLRRRAAEIRAKSIAQSAAGDEEKRRAKVLDELRAAQERANESQAKGTEETKKAASRNDELKAGVKGLAFEFPQFGRAIGLLTNPISAVTSGLVILIAKFQEAAQKRFELGLLNREFEKLQSRSRSLVDIATAVASSREKIVADYSAMSTAVEKFREGLDETGRSLLANQQISESIDDEELRSKLLDIDESAMPEAEKNLLRSRAIADGRDRKEFNSREAKRKGAVADFEAADGAFAMEKQLLAKAKAMDPELTAAQDAVDLAQRNLTGAGMFVGGSIGDNGQITATQGGTLDQIDKNLANVREGIAKGGFTDASGTKHTVESLRDWEQRYLEQADDLHELLRERAKDLETANNVLNSATSARDKLLQDAGNSKRLGDNLQKSGGIKRLDWEDAMRGARERDPKRENNDERERQLRFRSEGGVPPPKSVGVAPMQGPSAFGTPFHTQAWGQSMQGPSAVGTPFQGQAWGGVSPVTQAQAEANREILNTLQQMARDFKDVTTAVRNVRQQFSGSANKITNP